MTLSIAALLLNAFATWYMVGLIWFVQLVHYPQFAQVGETGWSDYHRRHTRMTTWAVGPAMLVELATAVLLCWRPPAGVSRTLPVVGLGIILLIWLSTAAVQVPCHNRLAGAFDAVACRRLVVSNGFRTAAWTVRGVIVAMMIFAVVEGR